MQGDEDECKCPQVLIMDDEPFNAIAVEGLLQMHNVGKVDKAYYGEDALRMVELNGILGSLRNRDLKSCKNHQSYKLIIVDKKMPLMGGVQFAKRVTKLYHDGHLPRRPMIVMLMEDDLISDTLSVEAGNQHDDTLFRQIIIKPILNY